MFSRIFAYCSLALIISSCAVPATVSTPLPLDLKITPPDAQVSKTNAALSGTWVGFWGGALAHTLVVERIDGSSASVVYSWGVQPSWGIQKPGFVRAKATISPEGLL